MLAVTVAGWEIRPEIILLGVIIGASYGLLGAGLVLVHRANKLINFAHGEVGVFAATIVYLGVNRWHWPYYVALVAALVVGAFVGAAVQAIVVGRLGRAPRVMSLVATLGISQLLVTLAAAISLGGTSRFAFPSPPGLPQFDVGLLRVTPAYTATIVIAPVAIIGLAVLLRATRLGLRMRASAANEEAARLAGIDTLLSSRLTWAFAAVLSAITAILTAPAKGPGFAAALGPSLLLRGLAPALIGRLTSLPVTLAAAIGLGVVEQVVFWNQQSTSNIDVVLLVVVLVATLLLPRERRTRAGDNGWSDVEPWRPVAVELRRRFAVRHLAALTAVAAVVAAALVPLAMGRPRAITLASMVAFVVVGVGLGVVTGLGGQLSLGHFAIAAIGGTCSVLAIEHTGNFLLGLVAAVAVGALVALLIGIPALRLSGAFLAVSTLAGALAVAWLLDKDWMLGTGRRPQKPVIGATQITSARGYYWFALAVGTIAVAVVARMRVGGMRRLLVAVRDGEDVARSFGVRIGARKLQSYVISGGLAGLGGALFTHNLAVVSSTSFPVSASIDVAVMVVVGGASLLAGPIVGVLFVIGVPAFLPLDSAGIATTKLGLLLLVVYLPSGLSQAALPLRDRLVRRLARTHRSAPDAGGETTPDEIAVPVGPPGGAASRVASPAAPSAAPPAVSPSSPPLLRGDHLSKRFGGITAVREVTLEVQHDEIVGLIGPNGAGKTTLFELLAGFTHPDSGTVHLAARDLSHAAPAVRARAGLVRSFQASPLFPTLTVVETIATALEIRDATSLVAAVVSGRAERRRTARAVELAHEFGLDRYAHRRIAELSTGTRRICELACMTALEPKVLLLDEPAAGLAQREVERLVTVLRDLQARLGCAMVVIEHDLPMITALSDRLIAMDAGAVIASGDPVAVRHHPAVVAAYLGASAAAIERSGGGDG